MNQIFVNLKRFDVPKNLGGICPSEDPRKWIRGIIDYAGKMKMNSNTNLQVCYILPESLIPAATDTWNAIKSESSVSLSIGCQSVHWSDVTPGGNFGAFTSLLPAKAAKNIGCTWSMVGHSEERRAKREFLNIFEPTIDTDNEMEKKALVSINQVVGQEVGCALRAGLKVLLCVGETEAEKGSGSFEDQKPNIRSVLKNQLSANLAILNDLSDRPEIVIGYEPIWAIGPGKTPPGPDYISFVSSFIKETVQSLFGFTPAVVYGGGLKEENAASIAAIETIDGGLVALTRFTGEIGYEPEGFKRIVEKYLEASK